MGSFPRDLVGEEDLVVIQGTVLECNLLVRTLSEALLAARASARDCAETAAPITRGRRFLICMMAASCCSIEREFQLTISELEIGTIWTGRKDVCSNENSEESTDEECTIQVEEKQEGTGGSSLLFNKHERGEEKGVLTLNWILRNHSSSSLLPRNHRKHGSKLPR